MGLCLSLVLYNCLRKRMLSSPYCCLNGIILPAGLVDERVRGGEGVIRFCLLYFIERQPVNSLRTHLEFQVTQWILLDSETPLA